MRPLNRPMEGSPMSREPLSAIVEDADDPKGLFKWVTLV